MLTLEELRAQRTKLQAELARATGARADNVLASLGKIDEQIADQTAQLENIARLAQNPENTDRAAQFNTPNRTPAVPLASDRESPDLQRRHAHAMLEHQAREGVLTTHAADTLSHVIDHDPIGLDALYLRAVANDAYTTAFGKLLVHGDAAMQRMNDTERHATEVVFRAQEMRAAVGGPMTVGGNAGLAIPFQLDPTLTLVSDGAVNPIRQLARVVPITAANEWKGINTAGVEANFAAELEEVADGTPELTQPAIPAKKAHVFVPFSRRISGRLSGSRRRALPPHRRRQGRRRGRDVPDRRRRHRRRTRGAPDRRDDLHRTLPEPCSRVERPVSPARTRSRRAGSRTPSGSDPTATRNSVKRLVASADDTEPQIFDAAGNLLGKRYVEASQMPAIGTGKQPLVYGSIRDAFTVVDRVGMSVELISHLFGAGRRPIGARGVYAWWRVGSGVTNPAAVRVLELA